MTTPELLKKLSSKYAPPAYAMLTQVRNGTGYLNVTRTADALVMSLWPSRGLELIGFELKVSRADWLRELKNPDKAEDLIGLCDRWYIVAVDSTIVQLDELPPTWGLMTATGRGESIKTVKEAPLLKAKECDRLFLASIFRNVTTDMISRDLIQAEIDEARESQKESDKYAIERAERARDEVKKAIADFEKISGLCISTWSESNKELAHAVKDVLDGKYKHADAAMVKIKESALRVAKFVDGEIQSYQL
jgi:hypothetical protein